MCPEPPPPHSAEMGLKAGGNIKERADRLFKTKGKNLITQARPKSGSRNPKPLTSNLPPCAAHPKPQIPNPRTSSLHPKPQAKILDPKRTVSRSTRIG